MAEEWWQKQLRESRAPGSGALVSALRQQSGLLGYQPPQKPQGTLSGIAGLLGGMHPMDKAALATAFVPGIGDAVGLAADARMYAQEPASRNLLNYGMTLAGLLPLVPAAAGMRSVSNVADTASDLRKQIPGLKLDIYGSPQKGYILSRIEVPKEARNSGIGTEVMRSLTTAADAEGAQIALSPSADFGGNKKRLEQFYKRFGFAENTGKARDLSVSETMIRAPKK